MERDKAAEAAGPGAEGEAGSPPAQAKPRSRLGPSRCPLTLPCVIAMGHHSNVQGDATAPQSPT